MKQEFYRGRLSLDKDRLSPYWYVTFEGADGRRRRRSTKVPVKGGMVDGVKVTAKLAKQLAYQRAVQIAIAADMEYEAENNTTVREWCDSFIAQHSRCISERSPTMPARPTSSSTPILAREQTNPCASSPSRTRRALSSIAAKA